MWAAIWDCSRGAGTPDKASRKCTSARKATRIVGPWFLHPFARLGLPLHYIVLRPSLDTAIERCRCRGGETLANPEIISALHQQFSMLGEFEKHVIETAGHSLEDTLETIQAGLDSSHFRLGAAA